MDRLHAMANFVAVVDCGGFASSSRKLNLSPSVVTRAVAELEARLRLPLLTRMTRVVRVTDAEARYADDCRRILAKVEEAETAAAGAHSTPRGTLTITAPVLFGRMYVTPLLVRYLASCPDVDVQCLLLDRVVNLAEEGVDLALRVGGLPDSWLHAVRVGQARRALVASPRYLQAHGVPQKPQDLADHTTIVASSVTPAPGWQFDDAGAAVVQRLKPRLTTSANDSAIAAAVAGIGIARLLSYQVASELRQGSLSIVLEQFEPTPLPVNVAYQSSRRVAQKVRALIDLAVDALRADETLNWSTYNTLSRALEPAYAELSPHEPMDADELTSLCIWPRPPDAARWRLHA